MKEIKLKRVLDILFDISLLPVVILLSICAMPALPFIGLYLWSLRFRITWSMRSSNYSWEDTNV